MATYNTNGYGLKRNIGENTPLFQDGFDNEDSWAKGLGYNGASVSPVNPSISSDLLNRQYTNNYFDTSNIIDTNGFGSSRVIGENTPLTQDLNEDQGGLNNWTNYSELPKLEDPSMFDSAMGFLNNNAKGISSFAQLAGLGMNAYSTFFGQGHDLFKKQMALLDTNIAANKDEIANRRAFNNAMKKMEMKRHPDSYDDKGTYIG